jgi:hypothetical protein
MEFLGFRDPYAQYMMLLERFKKLVDSHLEDTAEAEELRAKMDLLWFKIPEIKRREINRNVSVPRVAPARE